ncbi:MAG: sigma-70 family RNA polymerase sigma factor [Candidatus Pacebacteria bacterium]|nr:sigma-70 family RNA polymerase sigma factor [Candidatus Paceibacterota bacterium]
MNKERMKKIIIISPTALQAFQEYLLGFSLDNGPIEKKKEEINPEMLGEGLYKAYYSRIFKYFSFRLFNKSEAEDLAQTVFLKIFTSLKRGLWEGTGDLSYIFTVARNTLIDYFRRAKHALIVSDEIIQSIADSVTTSSRIEETEERERIMTAMKNLREEESEAVTLRYFADMEYPVIAKIMDKKEDAVRQLVHRGLKALKATLQLEIA